MEPKHDVLRTAPTAHAKAYRSPVVRDHGTIRDLTLGSNNMTPKADAGGKCSGGTDSHDCTP
jgi:hypothetical protein